MTAEETATATPPLRVISGTASAQEIAALVAVLAAASGDGLRRLPPRARATVSRMSLVATTADSGTAPALRAFPRTIRL